MSFIDNLKSAKQRLKDTTLPHRVVFHHVPKCGGTSVARVLRKRYLLSQATVLPEESFRAFEAFTGRSDREQMLVDVLDLREQMLLYLLFQDVHCVSLHVRFSEIAFREFSDKYKFITILREPISRFISHYFWSHGHPGAHGRIEEELEEFVETDRARRLGATYSEFYCGLPKEHDTASEPAISAAIENLAKFSVVGRLDRLEEFQDALAGELGSRFRIGHENKMRQPTSEKSRIVTPELRQKIEQLCQPDLAIWNAVFKDNPAPVGLAS